jgi:hypothetical protein
MNTDESVFEQTYRGYLSQIADIDLSQRADRLGGRFSHQALEVVSFGKPYRISHRGITSSSGAPAPFSVCVILAKYMLMCPPAVPVAGPWTAFKDFKDAGPLVVYYANNVEKRLTQAFSGRLQQLQRAAEILGAQSITQSFSHDAAFEFSALPRLPVLLLFNDTDDEFKAQCSVLLRRSAERFLDMESVAMVGSVLTDLLLKQSPKEC